MLTLLLLVLTAFAATEEGYEMNDVGGDLVLPAGWEMQEWSDWNFKAKTADGVLLRLYLTPFQVSPSDEAAAAWAGMYKKRLEGEGGGDFKAPGSTVGKVALANGEVDAVQTQLGFTFVKQKTAGILHAVAFPSEGQVVHVETISAARNDRKAAAALTQALAAFTLDKKPADATPVRVESEAGFALTPPAGWRAPLNAELGPTRAVTGKIGEDTLDPKRCLSIVRPPAVGDPDVIFACKLYQYLPPVDEYSFVGVEAELHELFFGNIDKPIAPAQQVQIGDRLGFLFVPPVAAMPVRLAVAPYDGGLVVLWGVANQLDAAGLDAAVQAVLPTVEYTGPDGGKPIVALDKRVAYYLKYRPTSPVVIAPVVLLVLLIGGVVVISRRKKPDYDLD